MFEEIVLPITDPETEWVRGRALAKMSPRRDHARVQMRFASALDVWAGVRGEVGTEWRFRLAPPNEARRPLVPDVAFVWVARLRPYADDEIQAPTFAPDLAVEILSPSDDPRDVADKVDVYLRSGVELVVVVDPRGRTLVAHDRARSRTYEGSEIFAHPALPDFTLDLTAFFARALDRAT